MLEELKVYEIRIDTDGHDSYGAFRVGRHDDLVTALGLSCLGSRVTGQELLSELNERMALRGPGMARRTGGVIIGEGENAVVL